MEFFAKHCGSVCSVQGRCQNRWTCDYSCQMSARRKAKKNQASRWGCKNDRGFARCPIWLSDLTTILQNEMGKLDKATKQRLPIRALKGKRLTRSAILVNSFNVFRHVGWWTQWPAFFLPKEKKKKFFMTASRRAGRSPNYSMFRRCRPRITRPWCPCSVGWCSLCNLGPQRTASGPMLLVCEGTHRYFLM